MIRLLYSRLQNRLPPRILGIVAPLKHRSPCPLALPDTVKRRQWRQGSRLYEYAQLSMYGAVVFL
jgi:hypothetical protein